MRIAVALLIWLAVGSALAILCCLAALRIKRLARHNEIIARATREGFPEAFGDWPHMPGREKDHG